MNGKQLKPRQPTGQKSPMQKSPVKTQYTDNRRYAIGKGIGLCFVAFMLIFFASNNSGRLIGSSEPIIDSHPGQFATYFFAGFAGICGLDLIRRS
ncbi:hypothetical protein [Leptothoe spongobia]|uniref:Uncharacterized protein n=1 Tax=Leptothoe spongobia TAU-MAC 1115 TaxID=1967444 RepID=A0A947DCV2_9CYAN|nr:hypothetical protein [Leptothoe spongobia]MBT9314149.1 hypothetical protein [Leptothoe spongobia TAU-MAC 1115]